MIDKFAGIDQALDVTRDGMTIAIGGFHTPGMPTLLVEGLRTHRLRDLVVVANGAGGGTTGLAGLILDGCVRKLICSFPINPAASEVADVLTAGMVEVELTPQGMIAERLRAGGAGLGGILSPTGVGTPFAEGKRSIVVHGREFLLEEPITPDIALVRAAEADRWGNLRFRSASSNFNVPMAMAARWTVAEIRHRRGLGEIDPESVHLPGIFVDAVVCNPESPSADERRKGHAVER
ncbi:MAG: 3-oxoacid CoA-transferase subunit A [Carbonactinosporaceae bacterium]